jgi:polyphosphate kinase 2 (PPK2 family)
MAAESKHYGDVANWVEKVIDSCTHHAQEIVARKLVRNFENQLVRSNIDKVVYFELSRRLQHRLDDIAYSRIEKRLECYGKENKESKG